MMKTLIQNKKIRLGGSLLAAILLAGLLVFAFLQPQTARAYEADGFTYTVSGNEATITGTTLTGSITIPSTIGGYPVTSIGSEAFQNATDITGVTIPNSIISIGNSAFYGCTGLTVVTIPNSVTSIGRSVFYNCKNLSAVTVPASITSIGTSAFYNATTSSAQVNYLGTVAQWCSITFANTSASPVYSSKMLYINDTQLTQITAEDLAGITAIKSYSFSNCSGLTTVTIPDSVTSIGKNAFSGTAIANDNANWFGGGLYVDRCLVQVKADAEKLIVREDARLLEGDVLTGTSLSTVYLPYAIKSFPQAFFSNAGNSNAAAFQIVMTDATTIPVNAAFPANAVIVALPTAPAAQYCAANGVAFQSVYEAFPFAASTSDSSYTGILARYDIIATWQEAKVICEALGGHLAVILSDREHTLVQTMLTASTGFIGYYIGASDAENEGEWKWIDGEPFSYTNAWHEGEPSNSNGNEHYLEYWYHNETFAWNDSAGGSGGTGNRGFICEFNDPIVYTPSKTAVGENGHIYLVFNQSSAWETAKDYCESFGGHLVTITSAEENTFVANLVADQLKGLYWIGLKRSSNNTWDWVTGESGFPEDPWDNGEPSGGSEYYAQMYSRDCYTNGQNHPAGSWNDNENSGYNPGSYYRLANTGFVCEIEPETYHPTKKGYSGSTAYEVYANHTNWYVAKAVAEAKGGHLITIGSQDENAFITQLISTIEDPRFVGNDHQNEPHFWLGACRDSYNWPAGLEGYQWVTGERLSSAFDSGFFYPNELQSVNEFVLAVDRTGQWNDFDAIGKRATERYEHGCFFIVEYENHQETVAFINAVTGEQTESVQQGNQPVDTSAVDRPGYTTHCFTDAACSNPFVKDLENPVVDPIPLYYTFTPNSYTATLDPAGGHFVNYAVNDHDEAVKIVTFDARYGVLPTPVREGYTFAGWFAPDGRKVETVTVSPFDPATQTYTVQTPSDHVLTAHWIGNSYTVSFDCVGGALPSGAGPVSVVYGAAYGALPTPEKAGAVFTGWRLQGTETEITAESVVAIAANHVLVAQWRERMLQNVTLQGVPAETTYSLGESFDPTGLELVLHYDNGETELCNELTWSPAEFTETGDVAMTFYYEEWNWEDYATVTVTRGDPIGVTLQTGPQQTVYAIGDILQTEGLTLQASYADGSTETVTTGFTCTPNSFARAGKYKITCTYAGFKTYFYVTVSSAALTGIQLQTPPVKTSYYVGEELDLTGLVLNGVYDNGTTAQITGGYTVECDTSAPGSIQATVQYGDFQTSFTVIVSEPPAPMNIITVSDADAPVASVGGEAVVTVSISENTGFMGFRMKLSYDPEIMTPIAVTAGDVISGMTLEPSASSFSEGIVPTDGILQIAAVGSEATNEDGTLFAVRFAVDPAAQGSYEVQATYVQKDTFDEANHDVVFTCDNAQGTITVVPAHTITWIVGGETTVSVVADGAPVISPTVTGRQGKAFNGWTPAVPDVMPGRDLTFVAIWISAEQCTHAQSTWTNYEPDGSGKMVRRCYCTSCGQLLGTESYVPNRRVVTLDQLLNIFLERLLTVFRTIR